MNAIKDLFLYLSRMQDGMEDKLWFVDKIQSNIIVDYGCADGTLLKLLSEINPNYTLIGVDISEEMLAIARENVPKATFLTVNEFFNNSEKYDNAALILSSVIHEIYSYDKNAHKTIEKLLSMNFAEIAIRDMFVSIDTINKKIAPMDYKKLIQKACQEQLDDYEDIWGNIFHQRDLIHFLLKYRYTENWDREVAENYLPVSIEVFLAIVSHRYVLEYLDHYCLKFIHDQILNDFAIDLKDNTHAKILLKRKTCL